VKRSTSSRVAKTDTKPVSTSSTSSSEDILSLRQLNDIEQKAKVTKVISDNGREREAAYDILRLIAHIRAVS
jgi:hypothetical protein